MHDIDWSEQVQVRRHSPDWSEDGEAVGIVDHILWDGITLDEALKRVMALPPTERIGLTIFAPSRTYSGTEIEALSERLPQLKALNGLVRLRSGLELDGMPLMQRAFGSKNPVLKFNDLSSQSDEDEQKGFMMMFSAAVAGLRNPCAHRFIHDHPERALEFIAFVSLLAKLLNEAKRT